MKPSDELDLDVLDFAHRLSEELARHPREQLRVARRVEAVLAASRSLRIGPAPEATRAPCALPAARGHKGVRLPEHSLDPRCAGRDSACNPGPRRRPRCRRPAPGAAPVVPSSALVPTCPASTMFSRPSQPILITCLSGANSLDQARKVRALRGRRRREHRDGPSTRVACQRLHHRHNAHERQVGKCLAEIAR